MLKQLDSDSLDSSASMRNILENLVYDELTEFDTWNQIPHEYSDGFMKRLHALFRRYGIKRKSAGLRTRKTVICIAAVIALALAACAAIEPIREAIITWHEKYVGIQFYSDASDYYPTSIEEVILPTLDEEWNMEVIIETPALCFYKFTNSDGAVIYYDQQIYKSSDITIDNTGCIIEKIVLNNDVPVYVCSYEDGRVALVWEDRYLFSIRSDQMSADYLIELIERMCK